MRDANVEPGSPTRFRSWLLEQLRIRQWTHSDLATRVGLNRSAITKWLAPPGSPTFRRPTYESCRALAHVLGAPLETVLQEAGLEPVPLEATPLQRRVMALIPLIADPMLEVIYRQLVPMLDSRLQESVLAAFQRESGGDGEDGPSRHGGATAARLPATRPVDSPGGREQQGRPRADRGSGAPSGLGGQRRGEINRGR